MISEVCSILPPATGRVSSSSSAASPSSAAMAPCAGTSITEVQPLPSTVGLGSDAFGPR